MLALDPSPATTGLQRPVLVHCCAARATAAVGVNRTRMDTRYDTTAKQATTKGRKPASGRASEQREKRAEDESMPNSSCSSSRQCPSERSMRATAPAPPAAAGGAAAAAPAAPTAAAGA